MNGGAKPKKQAVGKRPLVFLGVGVINTLLDFTFYTFLTAVVFKEGEKIFVVGIISGTFALFCAFLTHSLITWRDSHVSHHTIIKFVAFTGFGLWIVRPILLSVFIHFHGFYAWTQHLIKHLGIGLSYNFIANTGAFALMLVIVLTYNYFVYERFVFTNRKPAISDTEPESR